MIHFNCPKCGKGFTGSENCSGKKGKCSKCKSVVEIPFESNKILPKNGQKIPLQTNGSNRSFPPELQRPDFLDDRPEPVTNIPKEKEQQGKNRQNDFVRKLPWFIDIFFYPVTLTGMIMLAILAGVPFLIEVLPFIIGYLGQGSVVLGFLSMIIVFGGFFIVLTIALYKYWYFCQCIRDSAEGNIRIPQELGDSPGLGGIFSGLKSIVVCLVVAFAPAVIYGYETKQLDKYFILHILISVLPSEIISKYTAMDRTFYLLIGVGIVIFPMCFLSIVIHESIRGLNPILLITSIFKTFFQYIGIIIIFFAFFLIIQYLHYRIYYQGDLLVWVCRRFLIVYFSLIVAHLLGRFYYKNRWKLNWDV
jgi:hypothetical protein